MSTPTTGSPDRTDLTRLTVNLGPAAVEALDRTSMGLGDSRTNTVNRALMLYAVLCDIEEGYAFTFVRRPAHEDIPADTRAVVVFDAMPPDRARWRILWYWPLVLAALAAGAVLAAAIFTALP
jgi:hypothetical protein